MNILNELDNIILKGNIINSDENSMFTLSWYLKEDNIQIACENDTFNLNTNASYIKMDSISYRYARYRLINNFLKSNNYHGLTSNLNYAKRQLITDINYYEITSSET